MRDALALRTAGAFAIVLECVPIPLADEITRRLEIPTIGIGSGPGCDEVRTRSFPEAKHATSMDLDVLARVVERIDARAGRVDA